MSVHAMMHAGPKNYGYVGVTGTVYPVEKGRDWMFGTFSITGHRDRFSNVEAHVGIYVYEPDILTRISEAALKLRDEMLAAQAEAEAKPPAIDLVNNPPLAEPMKFGRRREPEAEADRTPMEVHQHITDEAVQPTADR